MSIPDQLYSRRSFVAVGTSLLGSSVFAGCRDSVLLEPESRRLNLASADTLALYADESGLARGSGYWVLGLLQVANPAKHLERIQQIRSRTGFKVELSYASTNRFKRRYAMEVIDLVLSEPDICFSAGVLRNSAPRPNLPYAGYYQQLIGPSISPGAQSTLDLQQRSRSPDVALASSLQNQFSELQVQTIALRSNPFMQIAGFLSGCIYGDATRPAQSRGNSKGLKFSLISYLSGRLGVQTLTSSQLTTHPKFRVRVWSSPGS